MYNVRWWDAAALAVASVVVLLTLVDPPYGPSDWGTWATTGAFLAVYVAYGRRFLTGAPVSHHLAIALLFSTVIAAGAAFEPSFAIMQAFVYPYVWATAPSVRNAIIANGFVALAIVAGYWIRFGPAGLVTGLAVAALSFGFSIALGLWITRIAEYGEERARLLDELQAAQGQLAAMHRDAGVTEERGRLAQEIHDTIAQSLTGMVMVAQRAGNRLEAVEGEPAASLRQAQYHAVRGDIELMEEMAREALTEARGLVASLAPVAADAGLADALRRLGASFERETGVAVAVTTDAAGLDRELEVVLLRSAQEALANVRKHAQARSASIDVSVGGDGVVLTVADDGVGPGDAEPGVNGFGLAGIRDRAAMAGGSFAFGPGPTGGSLLRVVVPRADAASATHRSDASSPDAAGGTA
ncbi:sensor histidine kinase [Agromyces sp. NPDC058484]|uniref:sensor histidine kinase n=1 Tax=Agromyces sp. NPDC058484 TaxID=3346524 RepID=UPI0036606B02